MQDGIPPQHACVSIGGPIFLFLRQDAKKRSQKEIEMGQMIRMTMSDGAEIAVYHAEPEGARRGGLVLIQEIFGVTDHIRDLCDEYAADGYEILAPSLYDREHPGFEADYTGPDFDRAVELARKLHPFDLSLKDAQTCIDALKAKGPVFITGYCYGGSVAWAMAGQSNDLAAASSYYGSLVPTMFADQVPKCATIAHFGRFDSGIPIEGVETLIAKGHPTAQIFIYEAGHGFNSDRRKDYHEPSADLARERTLALFKACGG
jgi:carboxymethylenebutenolidase